MNSDHDLLCSSAEWAEFLTSELVPWCLEGLELGPRVVELGGGFGAATGHLVKIADRLTVVENDPALAASLAGRFPDADVRHDDATGTALPTAAFDSAVCFTMLHHIPSDALQDKLFAEVARLLRPGAWFAGTDSLASDRLRAFHDNDIYHPIDPETLPARLTAAGFTDVSTSIRDTRFRFRCHLPSAS